MSLFRLTIIILFLSMFLFEGAFCADNYKIRGIITDNSDRMFFIKGHGNFKTTSSTIPIQTTEIPIPSVSNSNNISVYTLTSPSRYVIDIPNATLAISGTEYKFKNSSVIQSVKLTQYTNEPKIVRAVINVKNYSDLFKIKLYTDGTNIIIKYNDKIIDNSIQYKFYTPSGDMDKNNTPQNLAVSILRADKDKEIELYPRLRTKFYLSRINQNSEGLILKGLGSVSFQRVSYSPDNSEAVLILDNASMNSRFEGKTFNIPNSQSNYKAIMTINSINPKKIKLTLNGNNIRDYRFVVSPDGQSLYISHRKNILNTIFSTNGAIVNSYKVLKTNNDYHTFEINFSKAVTYNVFELNDNFYLDINNLGDYSEQLFKKMLSSSDIKIQVRKIAPDKIRYIIPMENLNFAYGNVESNSKSIKLCFKEKPKEKIVSQTTVDNKKTENINVVYIPKNADLEKKREEYITKEKSKKDKITISALKNVVLDPGHGGMDSGAIGGGYYEKGLNLKVANLVKEKLEKKNIVVYMTRNEDTTMSLEDRVNYSNEINPNIYVSIHTNSTVQEDSYGIETHYFKPDSIELAQTIHKSFSSEKNLRKWDTKDRGVIKSRFYVINHTEAPAVLIEIGFLSNIKERAKLLTQSRQEEIANAIAKGILEYLKNN